MKTVLNNNCLMRVTGMLIQELPYKRVLLWSVIHVNGMSYESGCALPHKSGILIFSLFMFTKMQYSDLKVLERRVPLLTFLQWIFALEI